MDSARLAAAWGSVSEGLRQLGALLLRLGREAVRRAVPVMRAVWRAVRPVLSGILQLLFALIIVFEEWGWRPLSELVGRLARWRPWAQLEYAIVRLPPYAALVVFVLPSTLLLPLKLLAVFLIAKGQVVLAGILFAVAKVGATALVARLFMLTQPALMQIGWFAWCYERFVPWKDALVERVHASWPWRVARIWKERARRVLAAQWRTWRPVVLEQMAALRSSLEQLRLRARLLARQIRERWAEPR